MPGGAEGRAILSVALVVAAIAIDLPHAVSGIHDDLHINRDLLGQKTSLSKETLEGMGVPEGARLLVESKSNCSYPLPVQFRPKAALICGVAKMDRKCLGIDRDTPNFIGKNCNGQQCVLDLVPPKPDCILLSRGIQRNLTDPELQPYCGIPFGDHKDWFEPDFRTFGCWSALPVGAASDFRVVCENGKLGNVHLHVKFSKPFWELPVDGPYTCKISILCDKNDAPGGLLVCYDQMSAGTMKRKSHKKKIPKKKNEPIKKEAVNETGGVGLQTQHSKDNRAVFESLSLTWVLVFLLGWLLS